MPGFEIKNLKEIEPEGGAPEEIEARFARRHLDSEELGVSYFRYGPGFRSPLGHRHRVQEEAYVVVSGSGRVGSTMRSSTYGGGTLFASPPRSPAASKVAPTASS
jgi:uncharacterized cupin superfamily protein